MTEERMGYKVRIIVSPTKAIVTPANLLVNSGDIVEFKLVNSTTATLMFPEENLFNKSEQIVVLSSNSPEPLEVNPDIPPGDYPYSVFCDEINNFAKGNSAPRMIVD